jgi:hypothetical protein
MIRVFCETDLKACRALWERLIIPEYLTDLWEVRECFHRNFRREVYFVAAEDSGEPAGLIPLSWIPEARSFGYFPGEVWQGKTWLEQNRIIARDRDVYAAMRQWLAKESVTYNLRYLLPDAWLDSSVPVDEIGYLFRPELYGFEMAPYYARFNRRSIKSIRKDVERFYARDLTFRFDDPGDFEGLVRMNIDRFGETSYFADERFLASFRDLMFLLREKGWLRMVTVLIEGVPAAIDIGAVYNNRYTLLAGGTGADYPGIAKVINLFHMERACEEKYREADFLCGDFAWKTIFHLTPRPLYLTGSHPDYHETAICSDRSDSSSIG